MKIGHELGSDELADLSVVTVPYRFGAHALGMLSILGPRRMPYARLLALASGTAETLSQRLSDVEDFRKRKRSMPTSDYYEVLGVARDASGDEIKRAYRELARQHHPDVAHDKSTAEHRFKEINEAYEVLSDPQKRAQYDRFGAVGNGGAPGPATSASAPARSATSSTCSSETCGAQPSRGAPDRSAAPTCATTSRSRSKRRSTEPQRRSRSIGSRSATPARAAAPSRGR